MTALPVPQHPIVGCLAEVGAALDAVVGAQPVYLSTDQKGSALRELAVLEGRLAELRLRVMAAATDVAETRKSIHLMYPPRFVGEERPGWENIASMLTCVRIPLRPESAGNSYFTQSLVNGKGTR